MLDRLEAAVRDYDRVREAGCNDSLRGAEALSFWIQDKVCPVVDQLLARPDFRKLARWPLDQLTEQANTEPRHLVENVENALVASAKRLVDLSQTPVLQRFIAGLAAGKEQVPSAEASANGNSVRMPQGASGSETPVHFIATKPWQDLVCVYDYFHPVADLNLVDREAWLGPNSNHVQIADFLPFVRPQLQVPGDFIVRTLMIRIEYWRDVLLRVQQRFEGALRQAKDTARLKETREAVCGIQEPLQRLEAICLHDPQSPLRQACITLVQVYAAYRKQADFSWLGDVGEMAGNAASIRYFVDRRADTAITNHVAAALAEVAGLYRSEPDPEDVIQENCRKVPLVIVDGRGRRDLYWHGELVDADWETSARAWTLMVALAANAKRGQGVDAASELGISLKDAKYDLKRLLPSELFDLIKTRRGVYRLTLPRDKLFAVGFDQVDRLTELS
jgi:hypothetical protein